jgi:hypothetical protein
MVVLVRAYEIVQGTGKVMKNNLYLRGKMDWMRFPNDAVPVSHLADNKEWFVFLNTFRDNRGLLLPRRTQLGHEIAYYVFVFGVPKGWKHLYNGKTWVQVFPGTNSKGESIPVAVGGFLQPTPQTSIYYADQEFRAR